MKQLGKAMTLEGLYQLTKRPLEQRGEWRRNLPTRWDSLLLFVGIRKLERDASASPLGGKNLKGGS